jgi:FkbM family methyltransferase
MKSLVNYRAKLRERGLYEIIAGRLRWYKQRFQMDNWWVGRLIELTGNLVNLDGITLSVDNPLIHTMHKSSIYFGIYEIEEREFCVRYIDRSLPTVEIGGCIGGVSCTVSKLLNNPSAHVVVECNPVLLPTLEKNKQINRSQFTIEPYAMAYGTDTISFGVDTAMVGSIFRGENEQIVVPTTTLQKLIQKHGFKTINLISDCEGAEIALIDNEPQTMRDHVKWFVVEIHPEYVGRDKVCKMLSDLGQLGFKIREHSQNVLAFENIGQELFRCTS